MRAKVFGLRFSRSVFIAGVLALLLALIPIAMDRAAADAPDSDSDEVTLSSFPTTGTATLHQLNPADIPVGQLLSKVTVTATVAGVVDGSLTNRSPSQPKTLGNSVSAGITVNGPGVSDLAAEGSDAITVTLAPGDSAPVGLNGTDSVMTEIIDPVALEAFVGTGSLEYDVFGQVETTVSGPASYLSTGEASGTATVEILYEFAEQPIDPAPAITIVKTNDADGDQSFNDEETAPAEDATVPFHIVITNTGNVPLTLTELSDQFGAENLNLFTSGCEALDGANLPTGGSLECTFDVADYAPAPGESLVNTVEVKAEDEDGTEVSADDPSTVNVEANPAISIDKVNDANVDGTFSDSETAPSEGADVDFKIVITNTGDVDLTLTSLQDVFTGSDLNLFTNGCEALDGADLAVGASLECTFTVAGYAPAPADSPLVNTVTVIGEDDFGTSVDASDPSTVIVEEPPCLPENHVEIKFDDLDEMSPATEDTITQDGVTITIFVTFDGDDEVDTLTWESDHPIERVDIKTGDGPSDGAIAGDGMSGGPYDLDKAISHISFFFCPPT